jgi:hypothetical protein
MANDNALKDILQSYNNVLIAVQAAVIEAENNGAESGMGWVKNILWGPGLLPSDEDIKMGAEAYYKKHHSFWKGQSHVGQ